MGHQIMRQPSGKYAVFSSITETFLVWNATAEELVEYYCERARVDAEWSTQQLILSVDAGERPYHQFTRDYDESCELSVKRGGGDPRRE